MAKDVLSQNTTTNNQNSRSTQNENTSRDRDPTEPPPSKRRKLTTMPKNQNSNENSNENQTKLSNISKTNTNNNVNINSTANKIKPSRKKQLSKLTKIPKIANKGEDDSDLDTTESLTTTTTTNTASNDITIETTKNETKETTTVTTKATENGKPKRSFKRAVGLKRRNSSKESSIPALRTYSDGDGGGNSNIVRGLNTNEFKNMKKIHRNQEKAEQLRKTLTFNNTQEYKHFFATLLFDDIFARFVVLFDVNCARILILC